MKYTLRFLWRLRFLLTISTLLLLSCIQDDLAPGTGADLQVGDLLPSFSVEMNDGRCLHTDELSGEVSLLLFFHTSCPDCQKELPVIQRVYSEWGDRVRLLAISREESVASVARYWRENRLTLPYSAQEDQTIYALFARTLIPRVYIVDRNLVIRRIYTDNPLADYKSLSADLTELVGLDVKGK